MRVTHRKLSTAYDYQKNTAWLRDFYKDKIVYCVGSGPSLKGFDFNKLRGCATIVINHTYIDFQKAGFKPQILVALDAEFFRIVKECGHNIAELGEKVFAGPASGQNPLPNLFLFLTYSRGVINTTYQFYSPALSGLVALNMALVSGAKKIYLLGYDCTEKHYYSECWAHPVDHRPQHYKPMAKRFNEFAQYKDKIINASVESNIETFKKIPLSEVKYEKFS